ncbi:TPA: GreA/GreB family elongation factor [Candidatus Bipolaricaulota bacterium]|nr:GreA/GreB family elongation factor [Candidatus Bipolaricaulota bacterium]
MKKRRRNNSQIMIGSRVLLRLRQGGSDELITVQLVRAGDPKELRLLEGEISPDSPLGEALLGRSRGESVIVRAPAGEITWEIVEVY